jgi:hypothetical protein
MDKDEGEDASGGKLEDKNFFLSFNVGFGMII